MSMYEYIKDSEKVLRRKPNKATKRYITEPVEPPSQPKPVTTNYNDLTKNDIVQLLWERGIEHNKRQLKAELIALLEESDK